MNLIKRIVATLHSRVMRGYERTIAERKKTLFAELPTAEILEIGPGVGANFSFLPAGCTWRGCEPNTFMHAELEAVAEKHPEIEVKITSHAAESLPMENESVDAVISTLVLCSVVSPETALAEIIRVLKPGGKFFFIEHVAAEPGGWRRRLQSLAYYPWRLIADGCCTNRPTEDFIRDAGFSSVELEAFHVPSPPMPPFLTPHIMGWATK